MTRLLASIFLCLVTASAVASETLVVIAMASCGPCQRFKADYAADPSVAGGRKVVVYDVREDRQEAAAWKARGCPTFVLVDGEAKPKNEIRRKSGYDGAAGLKRWIEGGR